MEDLQAQLDELTSRLDDADTAAQDLSDSIDTQVSDLQSTLDDHSTSIESLNETQGQLTFPLSQETIDLIKEQFPTGLVTLVAGTVTITDQRISPTSVILLSVALASGTQGFLSYLASAGSAVVSSTSNTDTSIISYVIMN